MDQYDEALGINDDEDIDAMDETTRRIAELRMQRRDAAEGKGSMGQRSRAPAFLQIEGDEVDPNHDIMERRRRRHYDGMVDEDEDEEEIPLDELHIARTDSLESWIALEPVRKTILREFRSFLLTHTDRPGNSTYGAQANLVGESEWWVHANVGNGLLTSHPLRLA